MDALMYINLISTFFVEKKLIHARQERLRKCYAYVMQHVTCSKKDISKIEQAISSFDSCFMQKWRASKCGTEESFKLKYDDWISEAKGLYLAKIMLHYFKDGVIH